MHNRLALARVFARFLARMDSCDATRDYIILFLRQATELAPIADTVPGVSIAEEARLLGIAFDEMMDLGLVEEKDRTYVVEAVRS